MLFNSYEFILLFLPVTIAGFFVLGASGRTQAAILWLVAASLFFYGWWNPPYLILLASSVIANFLLGRVLYAAAEGRAPRPPVARAVLVFGVALNLAAIGYFKYANFFVDNINDLAGTNFTLSRILLPLAISFFTFQQITYLVDSYRGLTREHSFLNYALFVVFFPQLIAGPIVHHSEMLPQFRDRRVYRPDASNLAIGVTIFVIGLFKKAVLADSIAVYGSPVFAAAEQGAPIDFFTAWQGALAYTFQLYFDFSGYSDMAIGLARMFGIRLPLNFNAPYKAANIIEFWRRWHMTLSRFLRDYVYVPLGGNRRGPTRRHVNIVTTMLLGGLWHGAGWTFVAWGGLHGVYLVANHLWHAGRRAMNGDELPRARFPGRLIGCAITFLAVVVGWVFFRAESFGGAVAVLTGMAGLNGIELPAAIGYRLGFLIEPLQSIGVAFTPGGGSVFMFAWLWIAALFVLAIGAPTTQELLEDHRPALDDRPAVPAGRGVSFLTRPARAKWRLTASWGVVTGVAGAVGLLALPQVSEFLYFQF